MTAEEEVEILRQRLAEADRANLELARQLKESQRNQPGKPKKKKSTKRTQTVVTETATVRTEAQTCTSPLTRLAARATSDTQTQVANVQVPDQTPSPICHPPSPIRHPTPEQARNNLVPLLTIAEDREATRLQIRTRATTFLNDLVLTNRTDL